MNSVRGSAFFLVGGAGFIGSHFTDALLTLPHARVVTVFDNFSSGHEWHVAHCLGDPRFRVVRGDVRDLDLLKAAMAGHDTVIHLASNPDIAKAATTPDIDFHAGTFLTHQVVEAMRITETKRILYASGSGVYGDLKEMEVDEDHGPLAPISTYGASKLAGEALIAAYTHMFDLAACIFRFGNVVGPRQTHGVGFDFVRRLLHDPSQLEILGDGTQSKSYIHVSDVVAAVLLANNQTVEPYQAYNVATGDYVTVREIADLAVESVGLPAESVPYVFTGGNRGWKGDIPIVRLATDRIRKLGWACKMDSRDALAASMRAMIDEVQAGRS